TPPSLDPPAAAPGQPQPPEPPQPPAAPQPAAPAPALAALDDLELRLSFRLGEALLTLSELRQAGIGTVIALDRPDGAPVDLVLNGQVIGTGQITTIAGQKACEIITLFGDG
ncbi:FliM/FliN family flagellar motor switch protein, partial [Paracoccus sanguinis]|uniref:FliM/FliN family flagellar motor switch protein n=1 Tax=Paracoccus sanguinis TaxID=1545044 RepID=UPI000568FB3F